ncbi:MAG: D-sedoheptulose 7-phosphate isomerase [Elusimicrobiales bacterium]|nr:D-sedoheptulose 7-phosphate isomerase [Elusimicrobiales bacterium]
MNCNERINEALKNHKEALENFPSESAAKIAELLANALKNGNKVLICGNGGSCSDSQHFAGELVGRFQQERPGLPAIALTADSAVMTCIGNDYGYEMTFARQVEALGKCGDIFIGITTSGNSANVVKAAEAAKAKGMKVIAFTGCKEAKIHPLCDLAFKSPALITATIQEMHITAIHIICGIVENMIFGDKQ